jgi:hypothetical protein
MQNNDGSYSRASSSQNTNYVVTIEICSYKQGLMAAQQPLHKVTKTEGKNNTNI